MSGVFCRTFGLCRKAVRFGLEDEPLRKQFGELFLARLQRLTFRLVEGHQATRPLNSKAAMFGLDARMALVIIGTLTFVGGHVTVNVINEVQSNSLIMDLREVGNAADKFHVDRGENLESVNSATELGEARKKVSQLVEEETGKPWRGKYIDYEVDKSQTDREVLISDKYDGIELLSLRPDTVWKNETETANSICSSSTKCALWAKAENVKKSVAKSALETINGSADIIDTGSARWDESNGNFYYNLDTSELDLSLFNSGSGDGTWITEPWGPCSVECGGGTQSRTVYCNGSTCLATKPAETQSCNDQDCPQWVTGDWSDCSQECDGGQQTRPVYCDGRRCPAATRPAMVQDCNMDPCDSGTWSTGPWGECSQLCGTGSQTRDVYCEHSLCADEKPSEIQDCNTDECGSWVTGDWSECSTTCMNEYQTREVACYGGLCIDEEPASTQSCGTLVGCTDALTCEDGYTDMGDYCKGEDDCRFSTSGELYGVRYLVASGDLYLYWGETTPASPMILITSCGDQDCAIDPNLGYSRGTLMSEGAVNVFWEICKEGAEVAKCATGFNLIGDKCVPIEGWYTGEWSECSTECADETKTRIVTCPSGSCTEPEPASSQACGTITGCVDADVCSYSDDITACIEECRYDTDNYAACYAYKTDVLWDGVEVLTDVNIGSLCSAIPANTYVSGEYMLGATQDKEGIYFRWEACKVVSDGGFYCPDGYSLTGSKCVPEIEWLVGEWGLCDDPCSGSGVQTRTVECLLTECTEAEPASTQSCSYTCVDPMLCEDGVYSNGDTCDKECVYDGSYYYVKIGTSSTTNNLRFVWDGSLLGVFDCNRHSLDVCKIQLSGYTFENLEEDRNLALWYDICKLKEGELGCEDGYYLYGDQCVPDEAYQGEWVVGDWSDCTMTACNSGYMTRTVTCSADSCPESKPSYIDSCNTDDCINATPVCEDDTMVYINDSDMSSDGCSSYTCVYDSDNYVKADRATTTILYDVEFYWGGALVSSPTYPIYSNVGDGLLYNSYPTTTVKDYLVGPYVEDIDDTYSKSEICLINWENIPRIYTCPDGYTLSGSECNKN